MIIFRAEALRTLLNKSQINKIIPKLPHANKYTFFISRNILELSVKYYCSWLTCLSQSMYCIWFDATARNSLPNHYRVWMNRISHCIWYIFHCLINKTVVTHSKGHYFTRLHIITRKLSPVRLAITANTKQTCRLSLFYALSRSWPSSHNSVERSRIFLIARSYAYYRAPFNSYAVATLACSLYLPPWKE